MIKIKFFSNYSDSKFLLQNYYMTSNLNIDSKFEFTIHDDYNVAVIFNKAIVPVKDDSFKIIFIQEPSWSSCLIDNPFFKSNNLLFVHDSSLFNNLVNNINHPTVIHYYDDLPVDFFTSKIPIKKKKISFILSNINNCQGHSKRLSFLNLVLNSDLDIDIYGKGHSIDDNRYKGELEYKYHGLADYEFSICIENSNEYNYITEKFIDCIICNTIPIYSGAPNISNVYLSGGFYQIDLDDLNIIDKIKNIVESKSSSTDYCNNINKWRYLNCYNINSVLSAIL